MPILRASRAPATCAACRSAPAPARWPRDPRDDHRDGRRRPAATSARRSGVVELTLALHRLLESPRDKIVWDTGHQAYAHKLLTGRSTGSGRCASSTGSAASRAGQRVEHDVFDGGHAGTGPVDRPGPGHRPRHAPLDGADRRGRRRRGPHERALARGAQRHRPPPDAAADRPQRQRDVDQPVRRGALEVPLGDQALARPGSRAGRR